MKKIYISAAMLMILFSGINVFANGQIPVQGDPKPSMFEPEENNNELPKSQGSREFDRYKYENIENLEADLGNNPDISAVFGQLKDESIVRQDYFTSTRALRDQRLVGIVLANLDKEKKCNQWWNRGEGFAAGLLVAFGTGGAIVLWSVGSLAAKATGTK